MPKVDKDSARSTELTEKALVAAISHQASCDLVGEAVILNLDSGIYYGLDSVGTRIWNLLRNETTVAAIRDALVEEYDVAPEVCLADLFRLLRDLSKAGLVEVRGERS